MTSYAGRHARYYDTIYADKPYALEARCIDEHLKEYGNGEIKNLLELACGTGRHAFELESMGYRITATDHSKDILAVAKENSIQRGSKVEFLLQDMRKLDLPEKNFDAAYCLFDSIGYVQTNEAILQVLRAVRAHLKVNGLFVFEFWHAAAMLSSYEPRRERSWALGSAQLKRVSTTELDVPMQLARVTYRFEETEPNGTLLELEETQINRYFLIQEMALFLEIVGFEALDWAPAYHDGPISEATWHIFCVARVKALP